MVRQLVHQCLIGIAGAGPCAARGSVPGARKQQEAHTGTHREASGIRVKQPVMDKQSKHSSLQSQSSHCYTVSTLGGAEHTLLVCLASRMTTSKEMPHVLEVNPAFIERRPD